jgi:hypothetical protein
MRIRHVGIPSPLLFIGSDSRRVQDIDQMLRYNRPPEYNKNPAESGVLVLVMF